MPPTEEIQKEKRDTMIEMLLNLAVSAVLAYGVVNMFVYMWRKDRGEE